MQICLNSPLPTIDGILSSFKPILVWPPVLPKIPSFALPCFPSPLFENINIPNMEMVVAAIEMQAFQMQTTMLGMIKPMLSFLGLGMDSFLPKIPGLPNLNLLDLLAGDVEKIISAVKQSILGKLKLPILPSPIYATLVIPAMEVIHTMQLCVSNYMQIVAGLIQGLIKKVTDKLKITAMPAIPAIPTPDVILGMIVAKLPAAPHLPSMPQVPSLDDVTARLKATGMHVLSLLPTIAIPGLPAFPSIPDPFVFSFNIPDIDMVNAMIAFYNHLTTGFLMLVMDFIQKTLKKYLSFSFPLICITLPSPKVPNVPGASG